MSLLELFHHSQPTSGYRHGFPGFCLALKDAKRCCWPTPSTFGEKKFRTPRQDYCRGRPLCLHRIRLHSPRRKPPGGRHEAFAPPSVKINGSTSNGKILFPTSASALSMVIQQTISFSVAGFFSRSDHCGPPEGGQPADQPQTKSGEKDSVATFLLPAGQNGWGDLVPPFSKRKKSIVSTPSRYHQPLNLIPRPKKSLPRPSPPCSPQQHSGYFRLAS